MVCNILSHCTIDAKDLHADGIASRDGEGVLGFVFSIAGAVEAQARFALHVHFLLATLGLQNARRPADIVGCRLRCGLAADLGVDQQHLLEVSRRFRFMPR